MEGFTAEIICYLFFPQNDSTLQTALFQVSADIDGKLYSISLLWCAIPQTHEMISTFLIY